MSFVNKTRKGEREEKKRNVIKADILVNMKYLFGNPHHRLPQITLEANHETLSTDIVPSALSVCVKPGEQPAANKDELRFKVTVSSHKRIKRLSARLGAGKRAGE